MNTDFLGRTPAFHLGIKFYNSLEEPKTFSFPFDREDFYVKGMLNLSHGKIVTTVNAKVSIAIPCDWVKLPPKVRCQEPWVKIGMDWHVYSDRSLCWILSDEWRDVLEIQTLRLQLQEFEFFAAGWCMNNSKDLIYKHYLAEKLELKQWHPDWPAWRHGQAGRADYSRERSYLFNQMRGGKW